MTKKLWLTVGLLFFFNTSIAATHRRAIVIGLDGATGGQLHYRALVQNRAPVLAELMATGKFTPCIDEKHPSEGGFRDSRCARTHSGHRTGSEFMWLTGPGWGSVLTGVDNSKHAIKDNSAINLSVFAATSSEHPTMMKRLVTAGFRTAAGGVSSFMTSKNGAAIAPGVIDYECGADSHHLPLVNFAATSSCNLTARQSRDETNAARDSDLTKFLETQINDPSIDFIMGVYDRIDHSGHQSGFSSNKNYLGAITSTDSLIARLIAAIQTGVHDRGEEWLVIVTSDHGGHAVGFWGVHDTRELEDEAIPFIVKTFGSNETLRDLTYPVTHMDVHPTVLTWFGLPLTANLDGHVQAIR